MKEFTSLAGLAQHLGSNAIVEMKSVQKGLAAAARAIEISAKDEIGHYQKAVGPFPEWAPLAQSTEDDKAAQGYPLDAPLLRTGDMRESIQHEVKPFEAIIGSTDPTMLFHEFGTARMPARPVMGPALYHNLDLIQQLVGEAAAKGLYDDGKPIHPSLGYDVKT